MNTSNKQAGFSLVELMVVVAIIGILATIAIPNFTKFQAKAKQSNAKAEMTGLYTAEKAFFVEFSNYHTNLAYVGYIPDGFPIASTGCPTAGTNLRYYITGFGADSSVTGTTASSQPTGAPTMPTGCNSAIDLVVRYPATVKNSAGSAIALAATYIVSAADQFTASSTGNVAGRSTLDTWSINQDKALTNVSSGL